MIVGRGYITITNIQGSANLIDWRTTWKEGELPSGWGLNGTTSENSVVLGDNPFGAKSLLWKCVPDIGGNPAGGFIAPNYVLDNEHTYRYTTFVYREKASQGNIFHGCYNVDNLSGGANTNPYFVSGQPLPAKEWYLLVGYIHPSKADTTWQLNTAGVFDMSGKKIYGGIDFKLRTPVIPVLIRDYQYYTSNPDDIAYFYNPRLEVCDGNELSIEQLLRLSTREEIDAVKVEYKSEIQKLDNKIAFSVSEVKTYTDGKVTAEAQRATADAQAKANAAQTAATAAAAADATTKANNAQNNAINDAATKYTTKTEHSSAITLLSNQIEQRVTKTVFDNAISDAQLLAKAMSRGLMLYEDPTFKKGLNTIKVYNNTASGSVVITREQVDGIPNDSGYGLKIQTINGNSTPDLGGFYFGIATKANKVMVCRFVAKVPENQRITFASNAYGAGGSISKWLTSNAGTGKWEEYAYYVKCGETGNFSSTFFFYLNKLTDQAYPVTWYLAYATVYDLNANEIFTPKAEYEAKITVLENSITSKVSQSTFDALGNRVTAAESNITQQAGLIASKVSQSTFDALGNRVTAAESSITQQAGQIALKVTSAEAADIAQGKVNGVTSNLLATGIDITNKLVTITADTFKVKDNSGNPIAVFSLNAAGKPILSANLIDANNLVVGEINSKNGNFRTLPDGTVEGVNAKFVDGQFSGVVQLSTAYSGYMTSANIFHMPPRTSELNNSLPFTRSSCGKIIKLFNSSTDPNGIYKVAVGKFDLNDGEENSGGAYDTKYIPILPQEIVEFTCFERPPVSTGKSSYQWVATNSFTLETYREANGNWYCKRSDGWMECGGSFSAGEDWVFDVNFPQPFLDTTYYVVATKRTTALKNQYLNGIMVRPSTRFAFKADIQDYAGSWNYYACGRWRSKLGLW